jgi:hypothetical protein
VVAVLAVAGEMSAPIGHRAAFVIKLIERRRIQHEELRDEAVHAGKWSQVSGQDGIAVGLLIAEQIVRGEFERKRKRK